MLFRSLRSVAGRKVMAASAATCSTASSVTSTISNMDTSTLQNVAAGASLVALSAGALYSTRLLRQGRMGSHNVAPPSAGPGGAAQMQAQVTVEAADGRPVNLTPLNTFAEIESKLPAFLNQGIKAMGFVNMTSIQGHTMPLLMRGEDGVGLAPTGSGKTVAFAIPSLAQIDPNVQQGPQVLVLCPVRELCQQTTKVFREMCRFNGPRVAEAYGGGARGEQTREISRGCDVLVATPGRLIDFLESGQVSFENLRFIIFDEADRMLDMGFERAIVQIMNFRSRDKNVQTMMWSATWPRSIQNLARSYLNNSAVLIRAGSGDGQMVNKDIEQQAFFCQTDDERMTKLAQLYTSGAMDSKGKCLMFVLRKDQCEDVAREVAEGLHACCGLNPRQVGALHGGMQQMYRDRVLQDFKSGRLTVLVATDVAARGLDVPDINYVVNYDAPRELDGYTHRIGRTGRMGRKGKSFTFVMPDTCVIAPELISFFGACEMPVPEDLHRAAQYYANKPAGRGRGRGRGRGGGGPPRGGGGGYGGGGGGYGGPPGGGGGGYGGPPGGGRGGYGGGGGGYGGRGGGY